MRQTLSPPPLLLLLQQHSSRLAPCNSNPPSSQINRGFSKQFLEFSSIPFFKNMREVVDALEGFSNILED